MNSNFSITIAHHGLITYCALMYSSFRHCMQNINITTQYEHLLDMSHTLIVLSSELPDDNTHVRQQCTYVQYGM